MDPIRRRHASSAFTLIELLVVIAIIAILAVVVVLTLNPAQLLAQSRDANRVSDMATLNSALGLYQTDSGGIGLLGTANVVYTSFPDASSTCSHQSLLTLPTGYSYNCVSSTNYRNASSSGWIPVNFTNISAGTPLGSLPIDPTNNSSSRLYYTYATNGSGYEFTAAMESTKYKMGGSSDAISGDGGLLASVLEKGTKFGLEPLDYGDASLVGYWPFNEGVGSSTIDASGNGNAGLWLGTAAGTNGTYYTTGKVGNFAGLFSTNNYINIPDVNHVLTSIQTDFTIAAWFNSSGLPSCTGGICTIVQIGNANWGAQFVTNGGTLLLKTGSGQNSSAVSITSNTWYYGVGVRLGGNLILYLNAVASAPTGVSGNIRSYGTTDSSVISNPFGGTPYIYGWAGMMDDVRIYNRALSAAEVAALYNAGK